MLIDGSRVRVRYAVDGGLGWAVVRAHLHPRHIESPEELSAFPGGLLHIMTDQLSDAGVVLPRILTETAFGQDGPAAELMHTAEPRLLSINDDNVLGFGWLYLPYRALVTIYRQQWLGAFLPHMCSPFLASC